MTCASIYACKRSGRHLVAYKEGTTMFEIVLSPLRNGELDVVVGGFVC